MHLTSEGANCWLPGGGRIRGQLGVNHWGNQRQAGGDSLVRKAFGGGAGVKVD